MTTTESMDVADGSATSVLLRVEVNMKITTENGTEADKRVQDKLKNVLRLKLGSNPYVQHTSVVDSFWEALTDNGRVVVDISHTEDSLLFIIDCPTVESRQDLEKYCASRGRVVQLAQTICILDPKFQEFHISTVKATAQVKGASADQVSPPPPAQHPVPTGQVQETPDSLKEKCERIKKEIVAEFNDENPRLLGSSGLGGIGVNVMMAAYLKKWKILDEIGIQQVTNVMLIGAMQVSTLLQLLQTRNAKHLIMFAHALRQVGLEHQLNCLEKEENRWVLAKSHDDMYTLLNTLYPDDTA